MASYYEALGGYHFVCLPCLLWENWREWWYFGAINFLAIPKTTLNQLCEIALKFDLSKWRPNKYFLKKHSKGKVYLKFVQIYNQNKLEAPQERKIIKMHIIIHITLKCMILKSIIFNGRTHLLFIIFSSTL